MDNINKSNPTDKDLLIGKIQLLAGKTKAFANPDELETYKKLIKKNVPWHLRGYFMAYLLKEVLDNERPAKERRSRQPKKRQPRNFESFDKKVAPTAKVNKTNFPTAEVAIDTAEKKVPKQRKERVFPDDARTLYLNIGKMKKLYAKELSIMLQDTLNIKREDVYAVRVHDKYSFITMSEANCERTIAEFNDKEIKGRTASITYSNKE
jgi:hypothetical protein